MTDKIAVFAELTARAGCRDKLIEALEEAFVDVVAETGTELYAIHTSHESPDVVWFYEVYSDGPARAAHSAGPAVSRLREVLGDLAAAPPRITSAEPVMVKGYDL